MRSATGAELGWLFVNWLRPASVNDGIYRPPHKAIPQGYAKATPQGYAKAIPQGYAKAMDTTTRNPMLLFLLSGFLLLR